MRFICMAIEQRSHIVDYLKLHVPGLEVVWDKHRSARLTWLSVLQHMDSDPCVLLEDDIVLTKNFMAKIMEAISERRSDIIQFHSRVKEDLTIGSRYRSGLTYLNNQCVYFPPGFSKKLLLFARDGAESIWEGHPNGTDFVMAKFLQASKMRYWNHCPSLVEHLPITSTIDPKRSKHRRSTTFCEPELEGLSVPILPPVKPKGRKAT